MGWSESSKFQHQPSVNSLKVPLAAEAFLFTMHNFHVEKHNRGIGFWYLSESWLITSKNQKIKFELNWQISEDIWISYYMYLKAESWNSHVLSASHADLRKWPTTAKKKVSSIGLKLNAGVSKVLTKVLWVSSEEHTQTSEQFSEADRQILLIQPKCPKRFPDFEMLPTWWLCSVPVLLPNQYSALRTDTN